MIEPVTQLLLSTINGIANLEISSGVPILPTLCILFDTFNAASLETIFFDKLESTRPGAIASVSYTHLTLPTTD